MMAKDNDIDYEFLGGTQLFSGTAPDEIKAMLSCLGARVAHYQQDEYIYLMGDTISSLGLVLTGAALVESVDAWGNTTVMGRISPGDVFAETYAALRDEPLMINVVAAKECTVLFCNVGRILNTCPRACAHHQRVSENLLSIFAHKNLGLFWRIFNTAPKSIRGKLLSYLSFEAGKAGSREFDIPFTRQQLADYLGVDRSALSNELSKMQSDGLLLTHRSHFILFDEQRL